MRDCILRAMEQTSLYAQRTFYQAKRFSRQHNGSLSFVHSTWLSLIDFPLLPFCHRNVFLAMAAGNPVCIFAQRDLHAARAVYMLYIA